MLTEAVESSPVPHEDDSAVLVPPNSWNKDMTRMELAVETMVEDKTSFFFFF